MAADEIRNRSYRAAFARHLPGKVVVDVGTGPMAILAQLAVEAGARKVYAIDCSSRPLARRAAKSPNSDFPIGSRSSRATRPPSRCRSRSTGASPKSSARSEDSRRRRGDHQRRAPAAGRARQYAAAAQPYLDRGRLHRRRCLIARVFGYRGPLCRTHLRRGRASIRPSFVLKNLPDKAIVSTEAPFEDLDYTRQVPLNDEHQIVLRVAPA